MPILQGFAPLYKNFKLSLRVLVICHIDLHFCHSHTMGTPYASVLIGLTNNGGDGNGTERISPGGEKVPDE